MASTDGTAGDVDAHSGAMAPGLVDADAWAAKRALLRAVTSARAVVPATAIGAGSAGVGVLNALRASVGQRDEDERAAMHTGERDGRALTPAASRALVTTTLTVRSPTDADRSVDVRFVRVANPGDETKHSKQCDLWAYVWASGAVLADVVLGVGGVAPAAIARSVVLELGAGAGLPSIVASGHCGASTIATDLVPDALAMLATNARDNAASTSVSVPLRTVQLDWTRPTDFEALRHQGDLVLAGDVCYLSSMVPSVVAGIATVLSHRGVGVIVDPGRVSADDVPDLLTDRGLTLHRHEVLHRLPTCVGVLAKCNVFVVRAVGSCGGSDGSSSGSASGTCPDDGMGESGDTVPGSSSAVAHVDLVKAVDTVIDALCDRAGTAPADSVCRQTL